MKKALAGIGLVVLATLATPAAAADQGAVYASANALQMLAPYVGLIEAKGGVAVTASSLGTGQLVLDVLDGKAVAAAIAMPLPQAVAAAREAAWAEGRMLTIPDSIRFHPVSGLAADGAAVGFVTIGTPPAGLREVLHQLAQR